MILDLQYIDDDDDCNDEDESARRTSGYSNNLRCRQSRIGAAFVVRWRRLRRRRRPSADHARASVIVSALGTLTRVRADRIDAELAGVRRTRRRIGVDALVHVVARAPVRVQNEARTTEAVKRTDGVIARVIAAGRALRALVDVWRLSHNAGRKTFL